MHTDQSPYWLLLGDYVVILYSNKDKALKEEPLNDFEHGEQWQEISFIEYWKMKQQILDTNAAYENRHMGEERKKIVDVIKGDYVENLPSFLSDSDAEEISYEDLKGQLVSGEFIRMKTTEEIPSGYLFAWMNSDYGFRFLRNIQAGTKLCRPIPKLVLEIPVPIIDRDSMMEIDKLVREAHTKRHQANQKEQKAISMVEQEMEKWNN